MKFNAGLPSERERKQSTLLRVMLVGALTQLRMVPIQKAKSLQSK